MTESKLLAEQVSSHSMRATHEIVLALEKSKSAMETLVMRMGEIACLIDTNTKIIWGNYEAGEIFGIDIDDFNDHNLSDLLDAKNGAILKSKLDLIDQAELPIIEDFQLELNVSPSRSYVFQAKPFEGLTRRRGLVILMIGRDITSVLKAENEQARLENELEMARLVQSAFLPKVGHKVEKLDISSYYQSAEKCSGDWWGSFPLGKGYEMICIGDVMGHGTAAALLTVMIHSICQTISSIPGEAKKVVAEPGYLANKLNLLAYDTFQGRYFMTFFIMIFDFNNGVIRFCNAGHRLPLTVNVIAAQKAVAKTTEGSPQDLVDPESLVSVGNPLGVAQDSEYRGSEKEISDGDRFILYTDGVIEAVNEDGKALGLRSFTHMVKQSSALESANFCQKIVDNVKVYTSNNVPDDDVTVVIIDIPKGWQS